MNCEEVRRLLHAHLDEELDVVNDAAVAAHLESCPACAAAALGFADQRGLLQERLTRHRAPADLAAQIRAALPVEARQVPVASTTWRPGWPQLAALAAGLALATFAGFSWGERRARADFFAAELTAAHARARLNGHAIDVASSDRHTVKPWFTGKVNFAPVVPDLAAQGFPLLGGRLEQLGDHTVATLVYGRRQHTIEVHVWKGGASPLSGMASRDGYALAGWRAGGLHFAAVADASPEDLADFVRAFHAAMPAQ